jgi:ATP-binding cassette, subfamily A (ABC1), member 3
MLMITSFVLDTLEETTEINQSLKWGYRLLPAFCLGDGLASLSFCEEGRDCPVFSLADGFSIETASPLSTDVAGLNLMFLAGHAVVYFVLAILIEYVNTFPGVAALLDRVDDKKADLLGTKLVSEHPDVVAEAERVRSGSSAKSGDVVVLKGLRKVYATKSGPKVAVRNLSFGISRGECFGFLGINGAGKTTTLKMLSGDIHQTTGEATVEGLNIRTEQSAIRQHIGYCPQHDALLELLTVREHLMLFARIKGTGSASEQSVVESKLYQLDLWSFADKTAGSLSGGNKRKLSVAIATIGEPSVVFLDEPSTGMDPVARRFMWRVLCSLSGAGGGRTSLILTTHSMEEAEALCGRIGVMVNGGLSCLGSSTHLKNTFGNGLELEVKLPQPDAHASAKLLNACGAFDWAEAGSSGQPISAALLRTAHATLVAQQQEGEQTSDRGSNTTTASGLVCFDAQNLCDIMLRSTTEPLCCKATAQAACDWWAGEAVAARLDDALLNAFPDGCALLERPSATACRYRVAGRGVGLGTTFRTLEAMKAEGLTAEYSVGMTTLEQIFNGFASSQENPEVE